MTLVDVRPFVRLITDWCLDQDDLTGFTIDIWRGNLTVRLEWQLDGKLFLAKRCFSKVEIDSARDQAWLIDGLQEVADRSRAEIRERTPAERRPS